MKGQILLYIIYYIYRWNEKVTKISFYQILEYTYIKYVYMYVMGMGSKINTKKLSHQIVRERQT